jgi:hypothetical protein
VKERLRSFVLDLVPRHRFAAQRTRGSSGRNSVNVVVVRSERRRSEYSEQLAVQPFGGVLCHLVWIGMARLVCHISTVRPINTNAPEF